MMAFDEDMVEQAVAKRSAEQKWRADQTRLVSWICAWHATHPNARIEYEDGRPGSDMRDMIEGLSSETEFDEKDILGAFGAAHCLLCDVVQGFRPALFSAWDRSVDNRHDR